MSRCGLLTKSTLYSASMAESALANDYKEEKQDGLTFQEREQIRKERAYERERANRLSRMGAEQRAKHLAR
jgi:hypothetical protein